MRGSGRFFLKGRGIAFLLSSGFNPLHCGAVVASSYHCFEDGRYYFVSIPFIAGQWSLQERARGFAKTNLKCFNPLHCGAVVASTASVVVDGAPPDCFNPLHCGAVVASTTKGEVVGAVDACFNPLHCGAVVASRSHAGLRIIPLSFQSPSLRGSGRFLVWPPYAEGMAAGFNPLHCGAVVASGFLLLRYRSSYQ